MRTIRLSCLLFVLVLIPSCVRMTHQLEQSRPLEINVNVRLQIQEELDEFFAYQGRDPAAPATQPAATATPVEGQVQ